MPLTAPPVCGLGLIGICSNGASALTASAMIDAPAKLKVYSSSDGGKVSN